jgi:hypothetical protein
MKTCIRGLLLLTVLLSTAAGAQATGGPLSGVINLVDQTWICDGAVDLDSVTVTVTPASKQQDAIHLSHGCTGRIGTIDVLIETLADGIKIGEGAHDLVIGGGTIRCIAKKPRQHQDGVQAMGGQRVHFTGLDVECLSASNSEFFPSQGSNSKEPPTEVVCSSCRFGATPTDPRTGHAIKGPASTVFIGRSVRSGVERSSICPGHYFQLRITNNAVDPVNRANTMLPSC